MAAVLLFGGGGLSGWLAIDLSLASLAQVKRAGAVAVQNLTYAYDAANNVSKITCSGLRS